MLTIEGLCLILWIVQYCFLSSVYSIRSRRGKPRGPPGSRELQTALKGGKSSSSFPSKAKQRSTINCHNIHPRLRGPPVHRLHPTVSRMGPRHENDPQCRSQVDLTFSISAILFLDVHQCHPQTRVAEEKASPTPTGISINNYVSLCFFLD